MWNYFWQAQNAAVYQQAQNAAAAAVAYQQQQEIYQQQQQQYQQQQQQQEYYQQQQQQQQVYQQQKYQPFTGTPLRKEAPISQKPAPVYQSQPVATSFQGKNVYNLPKAHTNWNYYEGETFKALIFYIYSSIAHEKKVFFFVIIIIYVFSFM